MLDRRETPGPTDSYPSGIPTSSGAAPTQGMLIQQELSLGDVIGKTFELYRRNFLKYFLVFLVVELVTGLSDVLASLEFPINTDITTGLGPFLEGLFVTAAISVLATWLIGSLATGSAIKMASQDIEMGVVEVGASVRSVISRYLWILVLEGVVGVITFLGFIALVVPGIILALMFCMTVPAMIIEGKGVSESMSRSRTLSGGRWLKILSTFIVLALIIIVISIVLGLVSAAIAIGSGGLGNVSTYMAISQLVTSVLSSLYLPLVPIMLTVFFYSNRARMEAPAAMTPMAPAWTGTASSEVRFCPSCGEPVTEVGQRFCKKCGHALTSRQSGTM